MTSNSNASSSLSSGTNTKLFDGVVVFTQLINSGSFTAAAEATGHSTSYISKEINKLEARLGVRLINRTTRSLGLTPEGKLYYEQCVQLVQDGEQALGLMHQHDMVPRGTLRISCPVALSNDYLQPILSRFMAKYPQVELLLDLNDRKVDVIQDGFDAVIRATHQLEESSLICRKIMSGKAYTVASHDYVQQYGEPQHPEELKHHRCLCYSNLKQPTRWQYLDKEGQTFMADVNPSMMCNNSDMELAMALDGHGICRLPAFTMQSALDDGKLAILFSDYPQADVDVYVVYPSRKHLSPKVRAFIDMLVDCSSVHSLP
ncbi:LysR family transcriptional regulator [Thalassotalea euphylliae]|uniref:LysR family transcriptional regulator n=1 Tax=Thalassotalea euphylliae TaxID=1655234 RepID=A0A3E0U3S4_9GAMM|nr:LysR family transcriptional regulator [Thalassotalea euphylliae]REL30845.1 LysR family transcriptional regulator [Thalassotalea euphylliae]